MNQRALNVDSLFSLDYFQACERFERQVRALGWKSESFAAENSPELPAELASDMGRTNVAIWEPLEVNHQERVLVLSSGLHGVEGFVGTAIQLHLLDLWRKQPPPYRVVLLHALNPYGYANLRRTDAHNRDLNRSFLPPGIAYRGAPELYGRLDAFLNPPRRVCPPDWYLAKALYLLSKYGFSAVQAAIAGGQYEFPKGLFYGGSEPSQLQHWLAEAMPTWLQDARQVVHLDIHSGLGRWGTFQLLLEQSLPATMQTKFEEEFAANEYVNLSADHEEQAKLYRARGSFGSWCYARALESGVQDYLFGVLEFGTYSAIQVLRALRAENALHFSLEDQTVPQTEWGSQREKLRLKEAFCPASEGWRQNCLQQALLVVQRIEKLFAS